MVRSRLLRDVVIPSCVLLGVSIFASYCETCDGLIKQRLPALSVAAVMVLCGYAVATRTACEGGVLSRDGSSELKGAMQVYLLLYHYLWSYKGAPLSAYVGARVVVSAFLLFTGFGQASSTMSRQFSIHRLGLMLVRLNLLALLLSISTHRSIGDYYFIPISSFWTIVSYCVCSITRPLPPVLRPVVMFVTVWALVDGPLQSAQVKAVHTLFGGDIKTWLFRVKLDKYSASVGVALAQLASRPRKKDAAAGTLWGYLPFSVPPMIGGAAAAGILSAWWHLFVRTAADKYEYNTHHTALGPFVVCAFLIFWWSLGTRDRRVSSLLVSLGKASLELYLLQYHLWLNGGAKLLLQLLPVTLGMPQSVNFAVTTAIFGLCSIFASDATAKVVPLLLPQRFKSFLFHNSIFVVIMAALTWVSSAILS